MGESVARPAEYYDNNIGSLARLLMLMANFGQPGLVFCLLSYRLRSTEGVTGDRRFADSTGFLSPYGYTKQVCEQLINDSVTADRGLRAVTLRYFNPIGAHPSGLIGELPIGTPNNLVPFITQTAAGLREQLSIYGQDYHTEDGTAIRDYIHVANLARAHVMALEYL